MGVDIVGIIPYTGVHRKELEIIEKLTNDSPKSIKHLYQVIRKEFDIDFEFEEKNIWWLDDELTPEFNYDILPSVRACLSTKEGVLFYFGIDAIELLFPVRANFLGNKIITNAIEEVCKEIAHLFHQYTGVIIYDSHPIIYDLFQKGKPIKQSLEKLTEEESVTEIESLMINNPDSTYELKGVFPFSIK